MKEILKKLCIDKGVSGSETEMLDVIKELVGEFAEVSADGMGDILVTMGDKNAKKPDITQALKQITRRFNKFFLYRSRTFFIE